MITITFLLVVASFAWGLSRVLSLPNVATLLLLGVVLNALGVREWLNIELDIARDALLLGLTFLVFHAGTELSPGRIGRRGKAALTIGTLQFVIVGALGVVLASAFGRELHTGLHYGAALAASSTLVVVRLLQQRRQFFEPWAQLVIGVLLVQDILVLAAITLLEGSNAGVMGLATSLGGLALLGGLVFAFVRWVTPWLVLRRKQDDESLLLILLSTLFLFLGLSQMLGLPLVAGAFAAGISMSSFPVHGLVRGQLYTLNDFFLALFFVSLGLFVVLPPLSALPIVLAFAALVLLVTPPLVAWIAERAGLTARGALESGLILAQTSEFSIVIGLMGLLSGALTETDLGILAMVTLSTMLLTPFLASSRVLELLVRLHPGTSVRTQPRREDHIVMLGCGELGFTLIEAMHATGHEIVVVEDDPAIVARLADLQVAVLRGDAVANQTLDEACAVEAKAIISLIRRVDDNLTVLRRLKGRPIFVRVFEDEDARRIEAAGGRAIAYGAATAQRFAQWFQEDFERCRAEAAEKAET